MMNLKINIKNLLIIVLAILSLTINIFFAYKLDTAYEDIDSTICNQIYDLKIELEKIDKIDKNMSVDEINNVGQLLYENCYPIIKKISAHRVHNGVYEIFDFSEFESVIIDLISVDDDISISDLDKKREKLLEIIVLFKKIKLPQNTYDFKKDPLQQIQKIKKLKHSFSEYNSI